MVYENKQKSLNERLDAMPAPLKEKVIEGLGAFARGFESGYEAAKAEAENQPA